jgi:hypothetical protein
MMESFGSNFGLGDVEDDEEEAVPVSLQEIIPISRIHPSKCFMAKKYSFSCMSPKRQV